MLITWFGHVLYYNDNKLSDHFMFKWYTAIQRLKLNWSHDFTNGIQDGRYNNICVLSGNNKMIWKRNDLKILKHIADSELSVILMLIPSNYEKSDTIDISTCMLIEVCLIIIPYSNLCVS